MNYCDLNETISEWQSEEFWIPYRSPIDNRIHRYFPDFFVKYIDKKGTKELWLSKETKKRNKDVKRIKRKEQSHETISANICG